MGALGMTLLAQRQLREATCTYFSGRESVGVRGVLTPVRVLRREDTSTYSSGREKMGALGTNGLAL